MDNCDIWYLGLDEPQRLTYWDLPADELEDDRLAIIAHSEEELGYAIDDPENYVIRANNENAQTPPTLQEPRDNRSHPRLVPLAYPLPSIPHLLAADTI